MVVPEREAGSANKHNGIKAANKGRSASGWKTAVCTQAHCLRPSNSHFPGVKKHTKAGIQLPRSKARAHQEELDLF